MKRFFLAVLLVACKKSAPQPASQPQPIALDAPAEGVIVAHIAGAPAVTQAALRARIDEAGASRGRYQDERELRTLLDNEIRFELLAAEALRRGIDKDPQVQEAARKAMVQKMLAVSLGDARAVSDADVKAYYQRNIGEYRQPERVQLELLQLETQAAAQAAAVRLLRGRQDAMAFVSLRKDLGVESNRDLELKYWSAEELTSVHGEALAKAAFATQELGTIAPVVHSRHGYYVFKLTGRRAAFHRAIADVSDSIRLRLFRQRRGDSFDGLIHKLREEHPVTIDEVALRQVFLDAPAAQPSSLPEVR